MDAERLRRHVLAAIRAGRTLRGQPCSDVQTLFGIVDRDRSGAISVDELRVALHQLDLGLPSAQLDALVDTVDTDADGGISLAEFAQWLREPPPPTAAERAEAAQRELEKVRAEREAAEAALAKEVAAQEEVRALRQLLSEQKEQRAKHQQEAERKKAAAKQRRQQAAAQQRAAADASLRQLVEESARAKAEEALAKEAVAEEELRALRELAVATGDRRSLEAHKEWYVERVSLGREHRLAERRRVGGAQGRQLADAVLAEEAAAAKQEEGRRRKARAARRGERWATQRAQRSAEEERASVELALQHARHDRRRAERQRLGLLRSESVARVAAAAKRRKAAAQTLTQTISAVVEKRQGVAQMARVLVHEMIVGAAGRSVRQSHEREAHLAAAAQNAARIPVPRLVARELLSEGTDKAVEELASRESQRRRVAFVPMPVEVARSVVADLIGYVVDTAPYPPPLPEPEVVPKAARRKSSVPAWARSSPRDAELRDWARQKQEKRERGRAIRAARRREKDQRALPPSLGQPRASTAKRGAEAGQPPKAKAAPRRKAPVDEEVVGLFLAHHSAHPEREPYEVLRAEAEALGRRTGAEPRRLLFDRLEQQYGVDPQRWWAARSTTALSHKLAAELGSAEAGAGFGAAAGRGGRRHEPLLADAADAGRRGARLLPFLRFCFFV